MKPSLLAFIFLLVFSLLANIFFYNAWTDTDAAWRSATSYLVARHNEHSVLKSKVSVAEMTPEKLHRMSDPCTVWDWRERDKCLSLHNPLVSTSYIAEATSEFAGAHVGDYIVFARGEVALVVGLPESENAAQVRIPVSYYRTCDNELKLCMPGSNPLTGAAVLVVRHGPKFQCVLEAVAEKKFPQCYSNPHIR